MLFKNLQFGPWGQLIFAPCSMSWSGSNGAEGFTSQATELPGWQSSSFPCWLLRGVAWASSHHGGRVLGVRVEPGNGSWPFLKAWVWKLVLHHFHLVDIHLTFWWEECQNFCDNIWKLLDSFLYKGMHHWHKGMVGVLRIYCKFVTVKFNQWTSMRFRNILFGKELLKTKQKTIETYPMKHKMW